MFNHLVAAVVSIVLYSTAYAFQMLPDDEQSHPVIEDPDNIGYFHETLPPVFAEIAFVEIPDTFPEEWCHA